MKNTDVHVSSAHTPHKQLKTIRSRLGITQKQIAGMLGVSYPYFLSVETGQRELSRPLANKIAKAFGVAGIQNKNAEPMMRDKRKFVPFTKEKFDEYTSARPSFYIEDDYSPLHGEVVTPAPSDYARCTQALLEAAEAEHELRPVITDFFNWFVQSIRSDAIYESLKRKFDELFPGQREKSDAFLALTVGWGKRVEDEIWREGLRKDASAKRAAKKRKQRHGR